MVGRLRSIGGWAVIVLVLLQLVTPPSRGQTAGKTDPSTSPAQTTTDYAQQCVLPAGVAVMRVAPPFPPSRLAFYETAIPGQARSIPTAPDAMILNWRSGQLRPWSWTWNDSPYNAGFLIRDILSMQSWKQVEADHTIMSAKVDGDIVVELDAPLESRRAGLQKLLSEAVGNAITIELREVERPVTVLSGEWKYDPVADNRPGHVMIEIYGPDLDAGGRGSGGGSSGAAQFAGALGDWVSQEVVIESPTFPKRVSWRVNEMPPGGAAQREKAHDPALVFKHIEEQTGLTAKTETRKVTHVFVQAGL
jgi:hypothetical protein